MRLAIMDTEGTIKAEAQSNVQAVLAWEGSYEEGDCIVCEVPECGGFYVIRVDDTMDEAMVYLTENKFIYHIPFYEKRDSYNPKAFTGERHYLTLRRAEDYEIRSYRNLALNVMDQHENHSAFPHAWANVETRGEAVFAARNAIDGVLANRSHGKWPYESWGINRQDDAAMTLEFGRPVDFDKVILHMRADFPHDNWWTQVTLTFSDGTSYVWPLEKSLEPQVCVLKKQNIEWIRLEKLIKSDDPSPFPALTQIQVYGTESGHRLIQPSCPDTNIRH